MGASIASVLVCWSLVAAAPPPSEAPPPPSVLPNALPPLPKPPEAQRLTHGVPLKDPDVRLHVVEPKPFEDGGRLELILYPLAHQLGGTFTQHDGSALAFVYHLKERFAFRLAGQWNWHAAESRFDQELVSSVHESSQAADSLLLRWGATAGVEVAPLYGKWAIFRSVIARFSLTLNLGVGVGATRHQLEPKNAQGPPTYGDTGLHPLASFGGGFRFQIGERFAFRLELTDLLYAARVDAVDGCNAADLSALLAQRNAGGALDQVTVRAACRVSAFEGTDRAGRARADDLSLAEDLVTEPSAAVLHDVGLYTGFSVLF